MLIQKWAPLYKFKENPTDNPTPLHSSFRALTWRALIGSFNSVFSFFLLRITQISAMFENILRRGIHPKWKYGKKGGKREKKGEREEREEGSKVKNRERERERRKKGGGR